MRQLPTGEFQRQRRRVVAELELLAGAEIDKTPAKVHVRSG